MSATSTSSEKHFGQRLVDGISTFGPLCAGVDPHPALLHTWGVGDSVAGLRNFSEACVEAWAGHVAVVKPQIAFFERFGSAGLAVAEEMTAAFREAGTLVITDAKRGDLDSTMAAYGAAYFEPERPLFTDALTVTPFLGGSVLEAVAMAAQPVGGGIFALALTSNHDGHEVQHAVAANGKTIAANVIAEVQRLNTLVSPEGVGPYGLVVGATLSQTPADVNLGEFRGPILAPGYGAQGATAADLATLFSEVSDRVTVNASRSLLRQGPVVSDLRQAAAAANEDLRGAGLGK